MSYSEYIFRRGFVLTSQKTQLESLQAKENYKALQLWNKTYFGQWLLWSDPRLNYATTRCNDFGVAVLGLIVNPYDLCTKNQEIADNLYRYLKYSEERFFDYVDELTGSFVILYRVKGAVKVIQDTASCKTAFYHFGKEAQNTVSSHANLVAQLHDLEFNQLTEEVYANEEYKDDPSRYLPGSITPYVGVLPMTANSGIDLDGQDTFRFFPREPLEKGSYSQKKTDMIVDLFRIQAKLLARDRKLYAAATGGRDSRLSLASFVGLDADLTLFSFHYANSSHLSEDVQVAKQLATRMDRDLLIGDLGKISLPADFMQAFKIHSPKGIWPASAKFFIENIPEDAVSVRSTVSEIGRTFYRERNSKTASSEILAAVYTRTPFSKTKLVKDSLDEFIEIANFYKPQFYNYDIYDMFYWEHRNPKWQNVLCAEAEMASDIFIPYNNRNLLKIMLSIPFKDRLDARIHHAAISKLAPAFDDVPFY